MDRDLRQTPLYREIEEHYRRLLEPSFGRISGAASLAPSPDGTRIAFTGTRLTKLEGTPDTRVCLVDLESREVEEITAGPGSDSKPIWSPDGTKLAFLSDREERGRNRLYLLDAGRVGEARPAPEVDGTVECAAWSPDGGSILLGVAPRGADKAGAEGSGTTKDATDLPTWLPEVETGDGAGEWRRLFVFDVAAGAVRQVSRDGLNVWEAAWCGPGRIAAVVSEAPGEDAWYESVLALIDVRTGDDRVLYRTGTILRQVGVPVANPSGSRLAVLQALCSDRSIVAGDVLLVDPETPGQASPAGIDGVDVTHLAWRDDDHLFWIGQRGLDTVAGELDAATGSAEELWASDETSGYWQPEAAPLPDGSFALVLESYDRAQEIAVVRDGKPETLVSFAHDGTRYAQEAGGRLERVAWEARDGLRLEGLLLLPPGPGPHPLVVSVHGGPISSYRNRWLAGWTPSVLVTRGYAVFLPNPRGSSGRGQEFAEHVVGDMGGADSRDIFDGVEALVERGIADSARLGIMGGSYGGFMTAWNVTQTDRYAAAVAISPVTNWYSQHFNSNIGSWDAAFLKGDPFAPGGPYHERSPVFHVGNVPHTPVLLTAGIRDRCTPPGQAVEFFRALKEEGVETEVVLYPEEGHGVHQMPALFDFITRIVTWFERHMPAGRPAGG